MERTSHVLLPDSHSVGVTVATSGPPECAGARLLFPLSDQKVLVVVVRDREWCATGLGWIFRRLIWIWRTLHQ